MTPPVSPHYITMMYHLALPSIPDSVYVVCRRGNDSQLAVQLLREHGKVKGHREVAIRDIAGGLVAWTDSVDPLFPKY